MANCNKRQTFSLLLFMLFLIMNINNAFAEAHGWHWYNERNAIIRKIPHSEQTPLNSTPSYPYSAMMRLWQKTIKEALNRAILNPTE